MNHLSAKICNFETQDSKQDTWLEIGIYWTEIGHSKVQEEQVVDVDTQ